MQGKHPTLAPQTDFDFLSLSSNVLYLRHSACRHCSLAAEQASASKPHPACKYSLLDTEGSKGAWQTSCTSPKSAEYLLLLPHPKLLPPKQRGIDSIIHNSISLSNVCCQVTDRDRSKTKKKDHHHCTPPTAKKDQSRKDPRRKQACLVYPTGPSSGAGLRPTDKCSCVRWKPLAYQRAPRSQCQETATTAICSVLWENPTPTPASKAEGPQQPGSI